MNKNMIPNFLTLSNGICGFLAIILAANKFFTYASIFIILSVLADRYDGIVARKLNVDGPLGKELDSICDVISFGAAPSFLVFTKVQSESNFFVLTIITLVFCAIYVACGAYRLARFNITTMVDGYYQGVPITTCGLGLAILSLEFVELPNIALIILTAIFGYLMVSKIKIKKI